MSVDNAVLIVDDEANILNALARLFLNRGLKVLRAGSGAPECRQDRVHRRFTPAGTP